ncbi:hepatitis A virus cellular receptor 1 homolog isoform X1 [Xenopus laevis]|uniref:Hepatitis A virus cellular receptor 1 homolog isoform X1 n=1 Tax=Xenopus laevis TaxID=8355 RepID=A0A8J1MSB6_XENLA|nr:hepatitis A virus cellular receptor 1 homolog isoform X1 [Xenopus laevis]
MLHSAATKQLITAVLLLCSVTLTCGDEVFGTEGQPVILPCTYKVSSTSDITTMCWGKNTCPSSKCNQPLVWTDGYKVTFTSSNRYELNGPIPKGTVSLTIKSVTLEDQGTYCCRVEHHGWFNDMKLNIRLVVKKAPVTTKSTITTLRTTTETIKPSAKPTTIPTTTYVPTTGNFITEHEDHHTTESPPSSPTWVPHCNEATLPTQSTEPKTANEMSTKTYGEFSTEAPTYIPEESHLPTTEFTTSFGNENRSPRETTQVNPIPTTESSSSSPSATTQVDEIHPEQGPLDNSQPGSSPFSGNVTIVETQKAGIPLYVLITVISVSVILITMVTLLVLKLRGKGSGAYFFHQNPSLELVTHADYLAEGAQTGEPELHKADWQVKAETNTDKENNKP